MTDKATLTKEYEDMMARALRRAMQPAPNALEAAKARLTAATAELAELGAEDGLSIGDVLALTKPESSWEPNEDGNW